MTLAIFDLDNTLIAGDSDHLWGEFLVDQGIVDGEHFKATNDRFYHDYQQGRLDIHAYQRFVLKVLAEHPLETLREWHRQFMEQVIQPIMLPAAAELLRRHRARGDHLLIITATNDFITRPIAEKLGVDDLLATSAEMGRHGYTGNVIGVPCYRHGKVERLYAWLRETGHSAEGSWFYSDSHNDLPLLEHVSHPVAVDPDSTLARQARERGWPVISLRDGLLPETIPGE